MKVSARLIQAGVVSMSAVIAACIALTSPREAPQGAAPILKAYQDSGGVWTLYNGLTYIHGRRVRAGDTCTLEECKAEEIKAHEASTLAVLRLSPGEMPLEVFAEIEDFVFNTGAGTYASSTMRRMVNAGDFAGACRQFPRFKYAYAVEGDVRDMRDGRRDGKALCTIRANQCYGVIVRRETSMKNCLKGVK